LCLMIQMIFSISLKRMVNLLIMHSWCKLAVCSPSGFIARNMFMQNNRPGRHFRAQYRHRRQVRGRGWLG
jgi:hypothetical protein